MSRGQFPGFFLKNPPPASLELELELEAEESPDPDDPQDESDPADDDFLLGENPDLSSSSKSASHFC